VANDICYYIHTLHHLTVQDLRSSWQ